MATKELAIKTKSGEIIPSSDLPQFPQALAALEELEANVGTLAIQARSIEVKDQMSYAQAGAIVAQLKAATKQSKATMEPFNVILKTVRDFISRQTLRVTNKVEETHGILTQKMETYVREEERKAKDEADRKQRELEAQQKREAEEKLQADRRVAAEIKAQRIAQIKADYRDGKINKREYAKLLKEAGDEAEAMRQQAELEAEERKNAKIEVKVEPNVPAMAGVTRRTNYKAKCVDQDAFLLEFAKRIVKGDKSLRRFVFVDDAALAAEARELKDNAKMEQTYPFVKAWDEKSF